MLPARFQSVVRESNSHGREMDPPTGAAAALRAWRVKLSRLSRSTVHHYWTAKRLRETKLLPTETQGGAGVPWSTTFADGALQLGWRPPPQEKGNSCVCA
jgi:hypothetical protein